MPAFVAINLEPEENVDDQIDTTKELHVDEALKRFQHALKLHAQGPRSREAAEVAYDELFESEIFKYREARTDYERAERQINGEVDSVALEAFSGGLDVAAGGADGVAANLALALYLSWKNRGQFFLDKLKDVITSDPAYKEHHKRLARDENAKKILDNWTAALDQDPSDPEVWRKLGRFAASLRSVRINRYCLEAAVELDDDPAVVEVEPPSLAEGLAGQQLKSQLEVLGDDVALSHPSVRPWVNKEMPLLLRRFLDPLPFLPDPTAMLTPPPSSPGGPEEDKREGEKDHASSSLPVPEIHSWPELGLELMNSLDKTERALAVCDAIASQAEAPTTATGTSKPQEAAEDSNMIGATTEPTGSGDTSKANVNTSKGENGTKPPTSLTRKRSQSAAGLADGADEDNGVEKRSKRVRRRDTAHAEEVTDPSKVIADQLQPYQEADQNLFRMSKNLLENIGVEDKDALGRLQELLDIGTAEDRTSKLTQLAAQDMRTIILKFNPDTASALINKIEQPTLGLSSFLEHAKSSSDEKSNTSAFDDGVGLQAFADKIKRCRSWMTSADIAFEWVRTLSASYASDKWSEKVKIAVVQMLSRLDATLFERISAHIEEHAGSPDRLAELEHLVPMMFELYVDIYERITNPSSVVDYATRVETKYRLARWLDINSAYLRLLGRPEHDPICIRFMWASVLASSLSDKPVREHILLMWTSLRDLMGDNEVEAISLPNNVVMPKISAAAADREISKLTTMDFFLGLFQEEMQDPVHVIDTLEPVLNPTSVFVAESRDNSAGSQDEEEDEINPDHAIAECAPQGLRDLWKFLENSGTELRLFLWSKLGDAYAAIGYKTKQLSCNLRSIEMVAADLDGKVYRDTPEDSRKILFVRMLKSLEDLLMWSLSTALNDKTAFEIIDEDHLKSSATAVAKLNALLHVVSLCEDEVKVGLASLPVSGNNSTFQQFMGKLRDMQIRAWCLQYTLLKAAVPQQESILAPQKELADFLASVHHVVGLRKFCKASNKVFLKLMRLEILKFDQVENWEDYLDQVLYDLYGLKLGMGVFEVQEHDCPTETLDKRQTMQLAGRVTTLAKRLPMKDLLKSELKNTIEHMQQTVGQTKSTAQMIHNLRNYNEYLKRPINPLALYRALEGEVLLDSVTVNTSETALANHGWFFLLGMIALTRFAGVDLNRRQTPGATDDLRIGATFLRLQLQFTPERWDAWFRLAECFDYELDEAVLWTADKINKDREDLIKFQRSAIHCYTLALSHSRDKDIDTHDGDPLHDLYYKFGMRLYSSSREPFKMDPFQHPDQSRFGIDMSLSGTFKRPIHEQMTPYKVWKFAARLFRMAMQRNPSSWKNPYMLAKCYWKMHQTPVEDLDAKDRRTVISAQKVIDVLQTAVETAHRARRSRSSDPIMEPHYKIASVLHKMVVRKDITGSEAGAVLSKQPLGIKFSDDDLAKLNESDGWGEYIVNNFSKLREKDKSNWQHRIIARHATTLFDSEGEKDTVLGAKTAFGILRESMFTKTMVMNVWKCDAERPGRHHVYTSKYTLFMTKLLEIMDDRVNLEALLRRLRKKGADFYHFTDLWEQCCNTYIKLLRAHHYIPSNDEVFKSMSHEEFEILSDRIADWAGAEGPHTAAFTCLKEAIELKKLNGGLMKSQAFDDFTNDCYSKLFAEIASTLPGQAPSKIIEERNAAKELAAKLEADIASQAETAKENKPASSLNNLLNPHNGDESVPGSATPMEVDKPEHAPRARRVPGVRRPDILRKAELAVSRSMEPPKSAVTKSRVGSVSSKRGSQTPAARASEGDSDDDGPDGQIRREAAEGRDVEMRDVEDEEEEEKEGDEEEEEEAEEEHRVLEGSPDESDLSDVPDSDGEQHLDSMFPELLGEDESGEEADSEGEGDEAEEGHDEDDTAELGEEVEEDEEDDGEEEDEAEEEEEEEEEADEVEVQVHTGMEEEDETMLDGDETMEDEAEEE